MLKFLVIAGLVLIAAFITWLMYNRRLQLITLIYNEIAEEEGGEVTTGGLSLQPTLSLPYRGKSLEISFSYSGYGAANALDHTVVKVAGLPRGIFEYSIFPQWNPETDHPRQTPGFYKTGNYEIDSRYVIVASNHKKMSDLCTPQITASLLDWAREGIHNGIESIVVEKDRLVFSVAMVLQDRAAYDRLIADVKLWLDTTLQVSGEG